MGNDSSKRAHRVPVGVTIQRVGIDDVGTEKEQKKAPAIITLSSGEELNCENVFGVLQQLRHELAADDDEVTSPKASKKKKRKAKLDYERCLEFLQLNILDSLKDKELRNGLFKLDLATFEELIQRDDLMVPDESCVLLLVGAWAERRAEEELGPDTVATTSEDNSATSAINLRGSEGLFQSLGKGAAKLLVAQPSTVADQGDKADSQAEPAVSAEPDGAADASAVETVATSDAAKPTSEAAPESSIEAPAEEAAPAEDAGLEVPINLRGTAGLYATLAEAYTTMVLSDEEMARKLQEKEEEDAKALRKLMEEEDEKLARALQEGELADGGSLPVGAPKAEEEEEEDEANLEPIPEHKLTPEYIARIQKHMLPLLPHIRFCMLPLSILNTLANEKLVPEHYLTEAYKYLMLSMTNDNDLIDRKNPRYRRRRYLCSVEWDHTWHGQHIQVSADGKKAIKTQSSWYSIACAKDGFQQGKHFWAVKVDGDEAYIGVTQKGNTSLDNYLGGNAQSWAFRTSYRYSTSHGNSHYGVPFGKGDVIGVLLDMDAGSLTFFKNGTNLGVCFTGLPRSEKLYPAVGWRAGNMTLVSLDAASVSPSVLM